jgi:uncharacterized protein YprB with RNaseH-like and TPR domain
MNELKQSSKSIDLPKYMEGLTRLNQASNQQYCWLNENMCRHRHRYTRHFGCFLSEHEVKERIAFLDIETSNLKADFGVVLCWDILDDEDVIHKDWLTRSDVESGDEDRRIIQSCVAEMMQYDRICTHFGTYFDIPFIRSRCLANGIYFPGPEYPIYHTDVWKMAKTKLCLHSNRQDAVAEFLHGKTIKTRLDHPAWRKAMFGEPEAMAKVVHHCDCDVKDLKKNFYSLLPFCKLGKGVI